ncbi:MAG TPA: MBL fold metallo-hydrolase [Candidatus Deferrimicrobium sp.]|nr:MBL fold metallo-hydrolase [Candidatus Deferrimicrobium sp.]
MSDSMKIMDSVLFVPSMGFDSNVYIVGKNEIGIIDTGASPNYVSHIIDIMNENQLLKENVKKLILTHIHPDHTGGVSGCVEAFHPTIYMQKEEGRVLFSKYPERMQLLEGGETIQIDNFAFQVIHTPGHSPGGMCLYDASKKLLFSGDTVFSQGSIGRTDLHGGDSHLLIRSIEKLLQLDVDYLCPGHMGVVRDGNRHIRQSLEFAKMVF